MKTIELDEITERRYSRLRSYVSRIVGWTNVHAIANALEAIDLAFQRCGQLWFCGPGDLVRIAQSLHRLVLGPLPFIMCDPRRGDMRGTTRSPTNCTNMTAALPAAAGGTLCVRRRRLPHDFWKMADQLRDAEDIRFFVVVEPDEQLLVLRPSAIEIPALSERREDIPRLVDEYVRDARSELRGMRSEISAEDRAWLIATAGPHISDLEKAAIRLVALRASSTLRGAAGLLGMAPVSLSRWFERRTGQPILTAGTRQALLIGRERRMSLALPESSGEADDLDDNAALQHAAAAGAFDSLTVNELEELDELGESPEVELDLEPEHGEPDVEPKLEPNLEAESESEPEPDPEPEPSQRGLRDRDPELGQRVLARAADEKWIEYRERSRARGQTPPSSTATRPNSPAAKVPTAAVPTVGIRALARWRSDSGGDS